MNYKDLSIISNNLRLAHENITKIYSLGFIDDDRLKNNFDRLDKALNQFEDIPNYLNTNEGVMMLKKSDKEVASIKRLSSSLLDFSKILLSYFSLIENTNKIDKLLDENKLDNDNLKNIVKTINFDLNNFAKIKEYGQIDEIKELDKISSVLYKIIKIEIRRFGYSELLINLKRLAYIDCIEKYISNDLKESDEKLDIDQKVHKIALGENEFIDNIENQLDQKQSEYNSTLEKYNKLEEERKNNRKLNKGKVRSIAEVISESIGRILPFLLSITVFFTANTLTIKNAKNEVKQFVSYYSTVDGSYEKYSENLESVTPGGFFNPTPADEGDVLIKVYGKTNYDGTKTLKVYKASEEFENLEEYSNVDLDNEELLYVEEVNISDLPVSYTSTDEVIEVAKINSNQIQKDMVVLEIVLTNLLVLLVDLIGLTFCYRLDCTNILRILLEVTHREFDPDMLPHGIIKEAIETINIVLDNDEGNKFDREELIKLRNRLNELSSEYQKLYENYSYLDARLSSDGYTRKLKK